MLVLRALRKAIHHTIDMEQCEWFSIFLFLKGEGRRYYKVYLCMVPRIQIILLNSTQLISCLYFCNTVASATLRFTLRHSDNSPSLHHSSISSGYSEPEELSNWSSKASMESTDCASDPGLPPTWGSSCSNSSSSSGGCRRLWEHGMALGLA